MTARVERWLYPVSLILLTQTTTLALGFASPRTVAIAAVETRVGEYEVALNLLKTVSDKGPRPSEFFLVQARAYVGLRQLKLAEKALARVTAIHLLPAKHLVAFEGASLAGDLEAMTVNGEHLLNDDAIPSSHRQRVQLRLARTRLRQRVKVTKAIHVLKRLARRASDYSVRAAAWQALARHGVDGARRTLQIEYPAHARQSETGAMEPVQLSEKQRVRRAENLFSLRAYALAQVDFLALSKSTDAKRRQLAQLRLGTMLMRLRNDYEQSATWLRLASEGPERALALDSAYRHAVVTGYLGHHRKASALMEDLVSKLKGRRKTNARYQIGRLLHEAGLYDQAVEKHRPFVQTRAGRRPKWMWFLGWSKFRSSDCGRAYGTFSRLKDNPNTLIGPKATYWLARCARLKGEHRRGEALLKRLGQQAPLTYYGLLGRALQGGLSTRRMQRRHVPEIAFVGPWQKQLEPETRGTLARIQALVRTGFIKLARHMYQESIARRLPLELGDDVFEQATADIEVMLEMWGARWKRQSKWVRRIPWRIGFGQLASEQAAEAYPAAYYHLAKAAGRAYGVSPGG